MPRENIGLSFGGRLYNRDVGREVRLTRREIVAVLRSMATAVEYFPAASCGTGLEVPLDVATSKLCDAAGIEWGEVAEWGCEMDF